MPWGNQACPPDTRVSDLRYRCVHEFCQLQPQIKLIFPIERQKTKGRNNENTALHSTKVSKYICYTTLYIAGPNVRLFPPEQTTKTLRRTLFYKIFYTMMTLNHTVQTHLVARLALLQEDVRRASRREDHLKNSSLRPHCPLRVRHLHAKKKQKQI